LRALPVQTGPLLPTEITGKGLTIIATGFDEALMHPLSLVTLTV
jgi:hypothetical protein